MEDTMPDSNSALDFILSRRSIRKFTAEPLSAEQIDLLQQAALAAPSAMNRQPWRFHFITRPSVITAIDEAALTKYREDGDLALLDRLASRGSPDSLFYGAPLVVIISIDQTERSGYPWIDAGIAAENIALAAQALGLGSCIIGLTQAAFAGSSRDIIGRMIDMPDTHDFAISIAIGHPATGKDPHEALPGRLVTIK